MKILPRASDELMFKLIDCKFHPDMEEKFYINTKDELCSAYLSPFLEQVKAHFREEYGIIIKPLVFNKTGDKWFYDYFRICEEDVISSVITGYFYKTYDEALEAGLIKACGLLPERKPINYKDDFGLEEDRGDFGME